MPTAPRPARSPAPRSLAEDLRARSDDDVRALLTARPDLAVPLPGSTTALATRATTRASVQRALEHLDVPALQVVEVLAVLTAPGGTPVAAGAVSKAWGASAGPVLAELRRRALVWGPDRRVHLVQAVRDALGPHPAGLGPPLAEALGRRSAARLTDLLADLGLPDTADPGTALARLAEHLSDPGRVRALLAGAPEGVEALLGRLTWDGPLGAVERADRTVRAATSAGPVDWLLAHGLLAVAGPGTVVLPREVGLALRGGRVQRAALTSPPAVQPLPVRAATLTAGSAEAAAEVVRLVDELLRAWGTAPPPVLRAGGLGVRELRRAAALLELDEAGAARVVETAYAAGLLADDHDVEPRWLPTPAADEWLAEDVAHRWVLLARPWLATTRVPGLVGTRDERDVARAALGPDLDRPAVAGLRRRLLAELAALPAGSGADAEELLERVRWAAPRRTGRVRRDVVDLLLADAAWLGVTAGGALSPAGRALLEGDDGVEGVDAADGERDEAVAAVLAAALPAPVHEVLLQADLTAVATGPLEASRARRLESLARVESRGGATVYRFDPVSVRRGLDDGLTAEEALAFLRELSTTGVPQPLEYLVRDVARRHGRVRVGRTGAYVRAEDPALLSELLGDRRCARLGLRALAPTVLASAAEPEEVLAVLREVGVAPAAEGPEGDVLVRRPEVLRARPAPPPAPLADDPAAPGPAMLTAALRSVRAGDADLAASEERRRSGPQPPALPAMDPVTSLVLLREAAGRGTAVWIGHVDADGRPSRHLVAPAEVSGGRITALDRQTGQVRSFSVHRVTGVVAEEPGDVG